jgi:hypothetical protein
MSIIPIELYHNIAQHCDHNTRLSLNQVNKDFKQTVERHMLTRISVENMSLQNVVYALIDTVSFRAIPEILESLSVYSCNTIREIHLRCAQDGNYSIAFPTLVPMPNLYTLDLQGDAFNVVRSQRWSIEGASIETIVENAPNLYNLSLASVNNAEEAMRYIQRLKKLRCLSLTLGPVQSFRSRREGLKVEGCEALEKLEVANYHEEHVRVIVVVGMKVVEVVGRGRVEIER